MDFNFTQHILGVFYSYFTAVEMVELCNDPKETVIESKSRNFSQRDSGCSVSSLQSESTEVASEARDDACLPCAKLPISRSVMFIMVSLTASRKTA